MQTDQSSSRGHHQWSRWSGIARKKLAFGDINQESINRDPDMEHEDELMNLFAFSSRRNDPTLGFEKEWIFDQDNSIAAWCFNPISLPMAPPKKHGGSKPKLLILWNPPRCKLDVSWVTGLPPVIIQASDLKSLVLKTTMVPWGFPRMTSPSHFDMGMSQ